MLKFMLPSGHIAKVTELHSRSFEVAVQMEPDPFLIEFDFCPTIPEIAPYVRREIQRRKKDVALRCVSG